jgi:hypothetical protein
MIDFFIKIIFEPCGRRLERLVVGGDLSAAQLEVILSTLTSPAPGLLIIHKTR